MKFFFTFFLSLFSAAAIADGFTCEHHQGRASTTIIIQNDQYSVIYSWKGSYPTEEIFRGVSTSLFIHDSITLYTLHDFINPGNNIKFTHYGVVGDFEETRFDCTDLN